MRKPLPTSIMLLLLLLLIPPFTAAEAGTFMLGAKGWYHATWDSAPLNIVAKQLSEFSLGDPEAERIENEAISGSGYMAGPVLGYQTDNGKLSFSFAPMLVSHFSQDVYGKSMDWGVKVDVSRIDLDFAAAYSLFKYLKVFAGFKYQKIEYDIEVTFGTITSEDNFDFRVYIPSAGIGLAFPLNNSIMAGIQAGAGLAIFSKDIEVENSLAFNLEANVTITPFENAFVQFGYRYQQYTMELEDSDHKATDRTYGPTFTFVFTF
jgi:opacity protein-like surface antigen